ncbi:MAG: NAD(P)/FAD-dependent oxidoreductase [Paracoccaceae bacterium]
MQHVVIIGAGIIGAALASVLSHKSVRVTVLDAGAVGQKATGASFGWINASFHLNDHHFRLRNEGIAAWKRLEAAAGPLPIAWRGALWWEEQGAEFDAFHTGLQALGYDSEVLDQNAFAARAPAVAHAPDRALRLPQEAAAESGDLARTLLADAAKRGAQVFTGVEVLGIDTVGGKVSAVRTVQGSIFADTVVVAAGVGTADLLKPLGVNLPMLTRPGVSLLTHSLPPLLDHVMVAPGQEFRQLPDGRLMAPTSANHQADESDAVTEPLGDLAQQTLARLHHWLPQVDIAPQSIALALRPVPEDGLPVVGPAGPDGLYVSVMHSGITLAAITAELATSEIAGGDAQQLLAPYRFDPARFSA